MPGLIEQHGDATDAMEQWGELDHEVAFRLGVLAGIVEQAMVDLAIAEGRADDVYPHMTRNERDATIRWWRSDSAEPKTLRWCCTLLGWDVGYVRRKAEAWEHPERAQKQVARRAAKAS